MYVLSYVGLLNVMFSHQKFVRITQPKMEIQNSGPIHVFWGDGIMPKSGPLRSENFSDESEAIRLYNSNLIHHLT